MAQKAVIDAVNARLTANWTRCPVVAANTVGETPDDGTPFLVAQFPVATVLRWPVESRYYREEGGIRLVLHVERGSGIELVLTWHDELAALFRDQLFDGVHTQAPGSALIHDENDEGSYFVSASVVPYYFNFTG